jgi:EAL domain-containing protein (putative c-di-GMP-specific phosphodiesterase class I)
VFELTESAVMDDPEKTKVTLDQLSELGFLVSVDDFGTGYSSFVNLKRLPIDEIKIDKSFVMNMIRNEDDESIVRATIQLGKSLGINVVAEGVEDQETLDRVHDMGCDTVQGYLIGKPMPMDQLLQHLTHIDQDYHVRGSKSA